jgi:type I restriction enzyme M protein
MSLSEILKESKAGLSAEVFGETAIKAVDSTLSEKNDKFYVRCQVRGKDVLAKPEEIIRQLWIYRLVHHLQLASEGFTIVISSKVSIKKKQNANLR